MQTAMDLLGSALNQLEELNSVCVDMTMPYEERVQKRDGNPEVVQRQPRHDVGVTLIVGPSECSLHGAKERLVAHDEPV